MVAAGAGVAVDLAGAQVMVAASVRAVVVILAAAVPPVTGR